MSDYIILLSDEQRVCVSYDDYAYVTLLRAQPNISFIAVKLKFRTAPVKFPRVIIMVMFSIAFMCFSHRSRN
jgi:hypothetical protein